MPLPAKWAAGRQVQSPSTFTLSTTVGFAVLCCLYCFGGASGAIIPQTVVVPRPTEARYPTDAAHRPTEGSRYDDLISRLDEAYNKLLGSESGKGDNRETRVFDRHGRVEIGDDSPSSSDSTPSSANPAAAGVGDVRLQQLAKSLSSSDGWLPTDGEQDAISGNSSVDAVITDLIQLLRDLIRARSRSRSETQNSLKLMADLVEILWQDKERT